MKDLLSHINESTKSIQVEYLLKTRLQRLKKQLPGTGLNYSILNKIYKRGSDEWAEIRPKGYTLHQWAMARVNSFISRGKSWLHKDADLAQKVRDNHLNNLKKKYTIVV